jgi:hypothetical protein
MRHYYTYVNLTDTYNLIQEMFLLGKYLSEICRKCI